MALINKCKITMKGGTIIIEVTSNAHPLDEVISKMFKGLIKSGMSKT